MMSDDGAETRNAQQGAEPTSKRSRIRLPKKARLHARLLATDHLYCMMTRREQAARLGTSVDQLYAWERGGRRADPVKAKAFWNEVSAWQRSVAPAAAGHVERRLAQIAIFGHPEGRNTVAAAKAVLALAGKPTDSVEQRTHATVQGTIQTQPMETEEERNAIIGEIRENLAGLRREIEQLFPGGSAGNTRGDSTDSKRS